MKKFILRTLSFLSPLALAFIVAFCVFFNNSQKSIDKWKLSDDIYFLFLVDSHVQQGINVDSTYHAKNVAKDSESYYFNYYKLKKLLKDSNNTKQIYLGFSYHNLSDYNDDYVLGCYSSDIATRYFTFLPFSEKINILQSNFSQLPFFFKQFVKNNQAKNYEGGYSSFYKNTSAIKSSMDKRINQQFYKDGKERNLSITNIIYLKKIINLCKEKKVKLFFLKTPLHPYYEKKTPVFFVKQYSKIITENDLELIDFKMIKFTDKSFIPDGDHLSFEGAEQVSNYLKKSLKNKVQ